MTVIEVGSLTKRFGRFTAVDGVDLTLERGEILALLGANGAGKTTLLRMILGLLRPSAGHIRVLGGPPSRASRRRIGYVPQTLGLWTDLTAAENLSFAAGVFGVDPSAAPDGTADKLVGDLPLGLQRRVAFAAALQHEPDLLVLDEPTSGVAPLARARLWDEIRAQSDRGTAVLVTTHYMDEARQADRLTLMASGRVIASGGESDIVAGTSAVVVETNRWEQAFAALEAAGLRATLAGRSVRVPGTSVDVVEAALQRSDVDAVVSDAPATIEEAMVVAGSTP